MKKNVLVLFGGKSVEHDISIITALQVLKNIDKAVYNVIPIYIERNGVMCTCENIEEPSIYMDFEKGAKKIKYLTFISGKPYIAYRKNGKYSKFQVVDFALLCLHGRFGEDGALQGILECSHIPYSSCNVRSSALTMDKIFTKDILISRNLPSLPSAIVLYEDYKSDKEKVIKNVCGKLKFSIILKPSNLGSSIGIKVCRTREELQEGIEFCAKFDKRILAEKYLEDFVEYNCACVHINNEVKTSQVSMVKKEGEIFSFEDKYLEEKTESGEKVDKGMILKIKSLTEKVYNAFDCYGVVRVDFIYDKRAKKLYINELNSIPGSLAFYLFKDLSFKDLITCLIEEGSERLLKEEYISAYDSEALEVFEKLDFTKKKK